MKSRLFTFVSLTLVAILVVAGMSACTRAKPNHPPVAGAPTSAPPAVGTNVLTSPAPSVKGTSAVISPTVSLIGVTAVPLEATATLIPGMPTPTPGPGTLVAETPEVEASPAIKVIIPLTPEVEPTATPGPKPFVGVNGKTYKVKEQDTLFSLAVRFATTIEAIKQANNLTNDLLSVGQELVIPIESAATPEVAAPEVLPGSVETGEIVSPPGPPQHGKVHVVKPGENLFRIALKYNVSLDVIAQANNIVPPWYVIYVGQRLTIP